MTVAFHLVPRTRRRLLYAVCLLLYVFYTAKRSLYCLILAESVFAVVVLFILCAFASQNLTFPPAHVQGYARRIVKIHSLYIAKSVQHPRCVAGMGDETQKLLTMLLHTFGVPCGQDDGQDFCPTQNKY